MTQKRIGLLGATFDPFHNGHLLCGREAIKQLNLDELWLIPNKSPTYKSEAMASDEQRWHMVNLAAKLHPKFIACDIELQKSEYQYTVETVQEIKKKTDAALFFVMGMDSFANLQSWYRWQDLFQYTDIVVCQRTIAELNSTRVPWLRDKEISVTAMRSKQHTTGSLCFLEHEPFDISSTEIRQTIKKSNVPLKTLMPESIADYIQNNDIYT